VKIGSRVWAIANCKNPKTNQKLVTPDDDKTRKWGGETLEGSAKTFFNFHAR